jgi:outer membrane lipoprotein SlyB
MQNKNGMLYPMMIIAAISVILFSIVGIATMTGHIPSALSEKKDASTELSAAVESGASAGKAAEIGKAAQSPAAIAPRTTTNSQQQRAAVCANCGVVESVQTQEAKGKGTGLGAVGGAVVGGVLGHQVGSGRGNDLATVAGAIGGGFAGNEIERNVKKTHSYVIRVRMEDGSYRTITQPTDPSVATGDRVRVENGKIVARG